MWQHSLDCVTFNQQFVFHLNNMKTLKYCFCNDRDPIWKPASFVEIKAKHDVLPNMLCVFSLARGGVMQMPG